MIKTTKSAFDILPSTNRNLPKNQRGVFRKLYCKNSLVDFESDYRPDKLQLFLGKKCNLKCIYCLGSCGKENKSQILSEEEYKNIIQQAADLGVKQVIFAGRGEPLLYPFIWKLMEYTRSQGVRSLLLTNAILVTPKIAHRLYDLDCSIIFKINSFDSKTQDYLVGVSGAATKMYKGVFNLMSAGFNKSNQWGRTRLINNNLLCSLNYKEVPNIIKWCVGHNIQPCVERIQWSGRAIDNFKKLQLTEKQIFGFNQKMEKIQKEGWSWIGAPFLDGDICLMEKMSLFINEKGNVVPCWMREDLPTGNVKKTSLKELWFDQSMVNMRQEQNCLKKDVAIGKIAGECTGRQHRRRVLKKKEGIRIEKLNRF